MAARNNLRAVRVVNGAFLGFCLTALLIALTLSSAQRQEPNAALLIPLLGGLILGGPAGAIVVMRLPEWPAGFPGKEIRAWGWCALGALIGAGIGFGWGMPARHLVFPALSFGLLGMEVAVLLRHASPLVRTLALMVTLSGALWLGSWAWGRHERANFRQPVETGR